MVAVVLTLVGLAACTPTPNEPSPSSSARPPTSSRPSTEPGPQDRDKDAVLAALRRLDVCALAEAAMAAAPVFPDPGTLHTSEPFRCFVSGSEGTLVVEVVGLDRKMRDEMLDRALGGAAASVKDDGYGCDVFLPVGSDLAVRFSYNPYKQGGACRIASDLAAAAASVLAKPEAVRMDPMWDACTLLAEAVDPDVDRSKLLGSKLSNCADYSTADSGAVTFDSLIRSQERPETRSIGGRQVRMYEEDESCDIYWRQGPFPARFAEAPDYQVRVGAADCDQVLTLAEAVIGVLDQPPPTDVQPQRPLLYPAN
jgi:hypothetical protein